MKKKILILSVSAGHGHLRAAEGLVESAARWFGDEVETLHLDLMTLVPVLFKKAYKDSYIKIVDRHPAFWGYLYARTDRKKADTTMTRLRKALESYCAKNLFKVMAEFKPDHIISTHFLPAQVLATWRRNGKIDLPLWVVVTDFVAHRYWLEPGQNGYFTASEENAWRMRRRGLANERIEVTGIPILPQFGDKIARSEGAEAFGLDPAKTTVLVMGGGEGVGGLSFLVEEIMALPGEFQLAVLTGRNQKLLSGLKDFARNHPGRLFPLPFTKEVHLLLAASDVVVSKPGGLTTGECLAMGKPMVVVSPIPGQEECNSDYLLENGAAVKGYDLSGLLYRLKQLLNEPERIKALSKNAAALGRPQAGRDILNIILNG